MLLEWRLIMNDTQKEFESWYLDKHGINIADKFEDGNYSWQSLRDGFEAWQACQNLNNERIDKLKADAKRYRYLRDNTSIMTFEHQKWLTSHRLDMVVDQSMQQT